MPQIWPMNWVLLMIYFILTFILFISLVYFYNLSLSNSSKNSLELGKPSLHSFNWKW